MYRPLRGSGVLSLWTAVTKTLSPQTTGDDQPRPLTSAHQTMLFFWSQVSGMAPLVTTQPPLPRNCGQLSSPRKGAPAIVIAINANRQRHMGVLSKDVLGTNAVQARERLYCKRRCANCE